MNIESISILAKRKTKALAHLNDALTAVFEIDDDVSYTELHIDDACRLMEAIMVMLLIDGGVDVEKRRWRIKYYQCTKPTKVPTIH